MGKLGILVAVLAGLGVGSVAHDQGNKREAFAYARQLHTGKGIINLGAGPHRTLLAKDIASAPEVVANIDIVPDGLPNFIVLNIETEILPFADKQFDCAFMSHVLEHLHDWEFALYEAIRVADHVVIALPHPLSLTGLLHPEHKQHFTVSDIRGIELTFPDVKIFY